MRYLATCLFVFMFLVGCSSDHGICKGLKKEQENVLKCKYKRGTFRITYKLTKEEEESMKKEDLSTDLGFSNSLLGPAIRQATTLLLQDVSIEERKATKLTLSILRKEMMMEKEIRFDRLIVHVIRWDGGEKLCKVDMDDWDLCNEKSEGSDTLKRAFDRFVCIWHVAECQDIQVK